MKFSNCVLVRVPINNNNYKHPIALLVIFLAKKHLHESPWFNLMLAPSRPANATSINKRLSTYRRIDYTVNKGGAWKTPFAFAVADCVLNQVCCGDYWKLRWVAGEACNMTENALSILIIFSVQLQQTEKLRQKAVYFPAPAWENVGPIQIASWKCNFGIYLDIQVYYLDNPSNNSTFMSSIGS